MSDHNVTKLCFSVSFNVVYFVTHQQLLTSSSGSTFMKTSSLRFKHYTSES